MNNIKKIFKVSCMVLMTGLLLCSCGPKNGFVQEDGGIYYYVNGEMRTGWQEIKGDKYYFYEDDYYYGEYKGKGKMLHTAWLKDRTGRYYYFDEGGKMLKEGMYKLDDGNYYCFHSNGTMRHDEQIKINGTDFIIDSNGVARKAPDFTAPAPFGGVYEFLLEQSFPKTIRTTFGKWNILKPIMFEVSYNSLIIRGIVELNEISYHTRTSTDFVCRLHSIDEDGIIDSSVGYAISAEIAAGEKTKFEVKFNKVLPLTGRIIYVEFYDN